MDHSHIVVEAKNVYKDKLVDIIQKSFQNIINTKHEYNKETILEELRKIPEWNATMVDNFLNEIKNECNWVEDLVSAVFISYVKILSSIKINDKKQIIKLKIPEIPLFLHKLLCNFTETIYYNHKELLPLQYEKTIEILAPCVDKTISQMLPFENILSMYLQHDSDTESEDTAEKEEKKETLQQSLQESLEEPLDEPVEEYITEPPQNYSLQPEDPKEPQQDDEQLDELMNEPKTVHLSQGKKPEESFF